MIETMKASSVIEIAEALAESGVRYLIAGGYAVVAHGYARFTADLDLIIQLESENIHKTFATLSRHGYRPSVPVTVEQFSDPDIRSRWIREKGMQVLNFFHPQHPQARVDLFVTEPLPFDIALSRAFWQSVGVGTKLPFVGLDDLIHMKRVAGRTKDLMDLEYLTKYGRES